MHKFVNLVLINISASILFISTDVICIKYSSKDLSYEYLAHCKRQSDINEHIPTLQQLATECASVVEIGVRSVVATWGILKGLSDNNLSTKSYLGIDLVYPNAKTFKHAKNIALANNIKFNFIAKNDMLLNLEPVDMLFIDSLHTYCHLTYELEKFSPSVNKYIALHDTSAPWGDTDDSTYHGNYTEYPKHINRIKRGLWPAVEDFLASHPEWVLYKRYFNNHGFTILKRIAN